MFKGVNDSNDMTEANASLLDRLMLHYGPKRFCITYFKKFYALRLYVPYTLCKYATLT